MNKSALVLGALVLALPSLASAQALTKCIGGQEVIDKRRQDRCDRFRRQQVVPK